MHYGYDRKRRLRGALSSLPDLFGDFTPPPSQRRSFTPALLLVNFLSTANKRNVPPRKHLQQLLRRRGERSSN